MIDLSHLAAGSITAGHMGAAGNLTDQVPAGMTAPGTTPVALTDTGTIGTSDTRPVGTPPPRITTGYTPGPAVWRQD